MVSGIARDDVGAWEPRATQSAWEEEGGAIPALGARTRVSYRRRGVIEVVGAGGVGIRGRQRRNCHELRVWLRASKVLLLGVVHYGGSARPRIMR